MLANIAKQSAGNVYPNADGSWSNSSCWHFNAGAYIYKDYDVIEPLFPASNNFTISYWIYIPTTTYTSSNRWTPLHLRYTRASGSYTTMLGSSSHRKSGTRQKLYVHHTNQGGSTSFLIYWSNQVDYMNQWINITMTGTAASNNAFKLYINNTLKINMSSGQNDFNINSDHTNPYRITIGSSSSTNFYISELGMWDVALDADAIEALYNNGSAINLNVESESGDYDNEDDLVAYYRFGDGTGDNPASKLHDETNSDHADGESDGDRDLTDVISEIIQLPITQVGGGGSS